MAILTIIFFLLRVLARHLKKQRFWWDDALIAAALICRLSIGGVYLTMVQKGLGKHAIDVPQDDLIAVNKLLLASDLLYILTLFFTKLSVLLMQHRIFDVATHFRRWVLGLGFLVTTWFIAFFFILIFTCVPVQKRWDTDLRGHCANRVSGSIASSVTNIASDIAIIILPLPHIWRLQLRLSEKVLLTLIFGLGLFVIFTSIFRLFVFLDHELISSDITYSLVWVIAWSDIETGMGIICACLPTLRPVFLCIKKAVSTSSFIRSLQRSAPSNSHSTENTLSSAEFSHAHPAGSDRQPCGSGNMKASTVQQQRSNHRLYSLDDDLFNPSVELSLEVIDHNPLFKDSQIERVV
ncbi:hypothetical protein BGW36DRAFT_338843 [Talaromyces proteolyticus]|uniref:Rhodopsin domain-containing protein n=1 Tax=Talaromyces proteolyticus TaxID=1131652 RepID=A0AAD4Q324_9EURO|nr:uncharacterized protein BGW36DRAFT_338843 [Talaromyces proteolyticus]KAH8700958.1 hypothetical protein BGW36DRAFT_338843 [Talaromyces proteolyticus]